MPCLRIYKAFHIQYLFNFYLTGDLDILKMGTAELWARSASGLTWEHKAFDSKEPQ